MNQGLFPINTKGRPVVVIDSRMLVLRTAATGRPFVKSLRQAGYFVAIGVVTTPTDPNGVGGWVNGTEIDALLTIEILDEKNRWVRDIILDTISSRYEIDIDLLLMGEPRPAPDFKYYQYRSVCKKCDCVTNEGIVSKFRDRYHWRETEKSLEGSTIERIESKTSGGAKLLVMVAPDICTIC